MILGHVVVPGDKEKKVQGYEAALRELSCEKAASHYLLSGKVTVSDKLLSIAEHLAADKTDIPPQGPEETGNTAQRRAIVGLK